MTEREANCCNKNSVNLETWTQNPEHLTNIEQYKWWSKTTCKIYAAQIWSKDSDIYCNSFLLYENVPWMPFSSHYKSCTRFLQSSPHLIWNVFPFVYLVTSYKCLVSTPELNMRLQILDFSHVPHRKLKVFHLNTNTAVAIFRVGGGRLTLGSVSDVKQWSDRQRGGMLPSSNHMVTRKRQWKVFSWQDNPKKWKRKFQEPCARTRSNERLVLFFFLNEWESEFSGEFGGEEMKPGFTQCVPSSWLNLGKCSVISVDPLMTQGRSVWTLAIQSQLHLWCTA